MDTTSEPIALTFIIALSRAHFDLSKRITSVVVEQIPDRAFNAGLKNVDRIADCDVVDFLQGIIHWWIIILGASVFMHASADMRSSFISEIP